jgi:hypothetical protein
MASTKRTPAPVKASAAPDKAKKAPAKAARASVALGERHQAGVVAAVKRGERLRMQTIKHSAAVARE